jgi:cytochrome bd-type quinol oxidase subunit 1
MLMLALGTIASSFWILANNSWMQVPIGHRIVDGKIIPSDWKAIIGGPVFLIRWCHMLLAAFLATAMCVIAAGASFLLRGIHRTEAQVMMHWGTGLASVLIVVQFFFGHLNGKYVFEHQPTKFAAIEARSQHQQPGTEVWFAIPDENKRRNLFAIETPGVGSLIATGTWIAPVYGLSDYPEAVAARRPDRRRYQADRCDRHATDGGGRPRRDGDRQPSCCGELAMDSSWLSIFWAGVIAFSILVYVVLDGYDLGVGILFGTTRSEEKRSGAAMYPAFECSRLAAGPDVIR